MPTDKDIREAAQKVTEMFHDGGNKESNGYGIMFLDAMQELKAALKPSKEQVADYLAAVIRESKMHDFTRDMVGDDEDYFRYAIDYLREGKVTVIQGE